MPSPCPAASQSMTTRESVTGAGPQGDELPTPPPLAGDSDRYQRAKALFAELSELPAAARASRLAELDRPGTTEAALLPIVRSLLAAAEVGTTQRFGAPIAGLIAELTAEVELPAGTRLGAWTLVRKIGEGGMGAVYEAQRSDGHFEQTVAIKLLRGLPTASALEFLARERQILAGLAHPNIARLLDGGATAGGQPFLVMEYLDGVPIDQYCRRERIAVPRLLQLLIEVCAAVSFAHSRLVVHCDLKPSNILVDAHGRPQLLDFGIARLLDSERSMPTGGSGPVPRAPAFTPGCASPEQERGEAVSTLADVYSLGRLLERLLGTPVLARSAELRAIVTRATQHEAAARYPSVAALSRDLRAFLVRDPVQAMPQQLGYRLYKLLQRRWPAVLTLAAFLAVVAGFTWRLAADRDRALDAEAAALAARDQAARAEASARQISNFLASILSSVDPDNARSLDRTLLRLVLDQASTKASRELAGQPAVRRQIESVVADSYRAISEYEAALPHYDAALASLDAALADAGPSTSVLALERLQLQLRRVGTLIESGRNRLAARELPALLAEVERRLGPGAELSLQFRTLAANQLFNAGDLKGALVAARAAQRAFEASTGVSADAWLKQLNVLSLLLSSSGDHQAAEALMQRAIQIASAQLGPSHSRTLRARHSLAVMLLQSRRRAEAIAVLRPLVDDVDRALGPNSRLGISARSNLGIALRFSGEVEAAGPYYRQAYERALQLFGPEHPDTLDLTTNLALYEVATGEPAAALARIEPVIAIAERKLDRNHPSLIEALNARAQAENRLHRRTAAIATLREVLDRTAAQYGAESPITLEVRQELEALEK